MSSEFELKKDGFILRFAVPFYKDAIEWNAAYCVLKANNHFDDAKLVHIATLSIEMLMKSILLLSFYNYKTDCKVLPWLKNNGHKIYDMYCRLNGKYRINLNESRKLTLKKWSDKGINARYKIDAFFYFLKTFGITSDQYRVFDDTTKNDLENYVYIFSVLQKLCETIFFDEYGLSISLLKNGKVQIPDCQLEIMKNVYK